MFYRGLGGINVDLSAKEPRQLIFRPQLVAKLNSVQARYVSALGPVESSWKRGLTQTEYAFTIPANAVATVQLISSFPEALKIDGTAPDKAAGVISTTIKLDRIELSLAPVITTFPLPISKANDSRRGQCHQRYALRIPGNPVGFPPESPLTTSACIS